jgi:hypothetical protein
MLKNQSRTCPIIQALANENGAMLYKIIRRENVMDFKVNAGVGLLKIENFRTI